MKPKNNSNRNTFVQITNAHKSSEKRNQKNSLLLELESAANIVNQVNKSWNYIFSKSGLSDKGIEACQPVYFRNSTLTIACDTPLILNHIRMHEYKLLDACKHISHGAISQLRITAKDKSKPKDNPAINQYDSVTKLNQILSSNLSCLQSTANSMGEGPLRDSLERLINTPNKNSNTNKKE